MSGCKAREVMRNEAYSSYAAVMDDERNAADGCFWAAGQKEKTGADNKPGSVPRPKTEQ